MLKKYTRSGKKFIKNKSYHIFYYNQCLEHMPIDEKAILLDSQQGKNLDGNIFYLLKQLDDKKYAAYKVYVAVCKEYEKEFRRKIENYHIKNYELIIYKSRKYLKVLATAKYLFNDSTFLYFFRKREGQIYFNTWHGTPYKNMGRRMEEDFYDIGNVQRNLIMSDYILYPNDYMEELMTRDYMIDNIGTSKSFKSGYPRIEIFFDDKRRKELRKSLGLEDKEVFVYMPTWRGVLKQINGGIEDQIEQYNTYLSEISKKLKKNQVLYVNFHPFLKDKIVLDNYENIKLFDRKYETYDFLNIADTLITDYSSVFFDFAITNRKIILFAYDLEEYFSERGAYFDIQKLPFPIVKTVDDLIACMNHHEKVNYEKFIQTYLKYESPKASEIILDYVLFNKGNVEILPMKNNHKPNILIYSGNLNKNGITASLLALLSKIDLDQYNIYVSYFSNTVAKNKQIIKNFDPRIMYYPITNRYIGTVFEKLCSVFYKLGILKYERAKKTLDRFYKNESIRCYGDVKFDTVIQFSGYGNDIITMYAVMDAKRIIVVHSNMEEEIKVRKNQTRNVLKYAYNTYDKVAIVNELLRENTAKISGRTDNIVTLKNIIDYDGIREKSNAKFAFDEETESNKTEEEINQILKSKEKKIISIGRFSPEKGYDRLISAFENTKTEDYLIIIGGFGPLYEDLMKQVSKSKKKDKIVLIKSLSNPYTVLKKCDAMIISSHYEGLPMVLYEAIVLGIPVVSTKIPTIEKFFQDYKGGTIVENSEEGLKQAIQMIDQNNIVPIQIDFKKYNQDIIKTLGCILDEKK